jgi:hypothetical protein
VRERAKHHVRLVEEAADQGVGLGERVTRGDGSGAAPVPVPGLQGGHEPERVVAVEEQRAVDLRGIRVMGWLAQMVRQRQPRSL